MYDEINKKVIKVDGGVGRVIALTGVIDEFAKSNHKFEVNIISPYPELFFGNPNINRSYHISHQYLYDDVLKNADYIDLEPYNDYYYNNKRHLSEVYAKMLLGELKFIEPHIYLSEDEIKAAKKYFTESFKKPIIFYQPFGSMGGKYESKCENKEGLKCTDITLMSDPTNRSLDFDFAEKLAKELKDDYDLVQIRSPDQKPIEGISSLLQPDGQVLPIRQIIAAMPYIKGVIACDSLIHHVAKVADAKSIVFWGTTYPENVGYSDQVNFLPTKKFVWTPNRMPHNNPDVDKTNKDLMKCYTDEDISKVKDIIKEW